MFGVMVAVLALSCRPEKKKEAALPVYTVRVAHPQYGEVAQYREWIGHLEPGVTAAVLPQVSGYVVQRLFTNGADVKKGQVLYRLDDALYLQALARAKEQQAEALANYEEACQNVEYYRPLLKDGAVAKQTFTEAQRRMEAADAALQAAKAAVMQAQTNLDYCTLSSPMDGVAGFARADVGSFVSPSSEPMVSISSFQPIRVVFSISEQDWLNQGGSRGALRPGAEVELLLANGEHYPFPAVISGVDNTVSSSTGTLQLDAHTQNPGLLLRPGMFVNVRARVTAPQRALLLPSQAITSIQGNLFVVELDEHNRASLVPVQCGLSQNGMVAVTGAVSEASRVVVSGVQQAMMAASGRAALRVVP